MLMVYFFPLKMLGRVQADFLHVDCREASLMHLAGKLAFVSGASTGIGQACVEVMHEIVDRVRYQNPSSSDLWDC
jgi:hypothetical protein